MYKEIAELDTFSLESFDFGDLDDMSTTPLVELDELTDTQMDLRRKIQDLFELDVKLTKASNDKNDFKQDIILSNLTVSQSKNVSSNKCKHKKATSKIARRSEVNIYTSNLLHLKSHYLTQSFLSFTYLREANINK